MSGKKSVLSDKAKEYLKKNSLSGKNRGKKKVDSSEIKKAIQSFDNEDKILFLNKGKGLPVGTEREYSGRKFKKVSHGVWDEIH